MRRISLIAAAASVAMIALFAADTARAAPYHLIRWQDTGFCQIWDEAIPNTPYPGNYDVIEGSETPNFADALIYKGELLRGGICSS